MPCPTASNSTQAQSPVAIFVRASKVAIIVATRTPTSNMSGVWDAEDEAADAASDAQSARTGDLVTPRKGPGPGSNAASKFRRMENGGDNSDSGGDGGGSGSSAEGGQQRVRGGKPRGSPSRGLGGRTKAKAKGKACVRKSSTKQSKSGMVQCRGCRKFFPGVVFGVNNVWCPEDKKAIGRIRTIAQSLGKKALDFSTSK